METSACETVYKRWAYACALHRTFTRWTWCVYFDAQHCSSLEESSNNKGAPHVSPQRGDISGFLEGYAATHRPLLTLHHLMLNLDFMPGTSNTAAAAAMMRAHADAPRSFMKRLVARPAPNTTLVLTVGYSLQVIPRNVSDAELQHTEVTMHPWRLPLWEHARSEGYHFSTRPRDVNTTRYYFLDALRRPVAMHVYGDERRQTVVVVCGGCDAPGGLCTAPLGEGWALSVPAVRCQ